MKMKNKRIIFTLFPLALGFFLVLAGCPNPNGENPDPNAPVVLSFSPAPGSMHLPLDTVFTVTFDKGLDPESTGTVTISSPAMVLEDGVNASIDFAATTAENDTVTLTPIEPLLLNTTYSGVSVEGFRSADGAEMTTPETLDWEISTLNYFFFGGMPAGAADVELYRTDGTEGGTVLVKEINPDGDSWPQFLGQDGHKVYFAAQYDGTGLEGLFFTDGTEAGTELVKSGIGFPYEKEAVFSEGALYFSGDDGENGFELWTSDGTAGGTALLKDLNTPIGDSSRPMDFIEYDNEVYFRARDDTFTYYLWKSDGTAAGTGKVSPAFIVQDRMAVMGDVLYLSGHPEGSDETEELYAYDGSAFTQVSDDSDYNPMDPGDLAAAGDNLFFRFGNPNYDLFVSDGTTAGTAVLSTVGSYPESLSAFGELLLFSGNSGSDNELWKSDGSDSGTVLVKDINPGSDFSSYPDYFRMVNGVAIFSAYTESEGTELWKSDGTEAGTEIIIDLNSGVDDGVYMNEPG